MHTEGVAGSEEAGIGGIAGPTPRTMLVRLQAVEAVGAQEDVGLPLQGLAEWVAALGNDVVEDAAC